GYLWSNEEVVRLGLSPSMYAFCFAKAGKLEGLMQRSWTCTMDIEAENLSISNPKLIGISQAADDLKSDISLGSGLLAAALDACVDSLRSHRREDIISRFRSRHDD
ncbi:MAG: hypothetical protein AABW49_04700, partial [Nanoarchaeota archaeon]